MNGKTTFLFVLFCLGITHYSLATPLALFNQETNSFELCHLPPDSGEVFTEVENMPEFPGGEQALFRYLAKNIIYPVKAKYSGIEGRVFVQFVIKENGAVTKVKVLKGIGGGCDREAKKVVKGMPKWKPGSHKGKTVKVRYNMPVRFTLK